jgi:hypothetical protein
MITRSRRRDYSPAPAKRITDTMLYAPASTSISVLLFFLLVSEYYRFKFDAIVKLKPIRNFISVYVKHKKNAPNFRSGRFLVWTGE